MRGELKRGTLIIHFFHCNLYIFLSIVVGFHRNPNGEDLFHNLFFRLYIICHLWFEFSLQLKKVEVRGHLDHNVLEHRFKFHEIREVLSQYTKVLP